ncbi:chromosome partitioning protein [Prevotella sp. tc2-28]|uniref:ParA family protein n=1 Tax=Prevotella sp. tc2-28 TaxID=1761888 RepID=UPI00089846F2|nr:ParA family protein [Prevotella sp. tc2-28]SDZ91617.1 chromosome partitioning protein [Prevotella sp. tc2-28]
MNKFILFSNIKGGVGKTTLCAHFTEYLAEQEFPVAAVDADLQASLSRHRERDVKEDPERPIPWEVIKLNTFEKDKVESVVKKLKKVDGVIVVDCPGNLNDNNLSVLFEAADLIVVPMAFDVDTIDATGIFTNVVKKRSKAKLLFLPNRINVSEGKAKELEMRDKIIKDLNRIGKVLPRIKQSVIIKRYTTIYPLDMYQYMALEEPFNAIIAEIKKIK